MVVCITVFAVVIIASMVSIWKTLAICKVIAG